MELTGFVAEFNFAIFTIQLFILCFFYHSGTLSLLAGVSPGCHPALYKYYIRRVRFSSDSDLVKYCAGQGYKVEPELRLDGTYDHATSIVEFPMRTPPGTVLAANCSAIQQLEIVRELQQNWSDNAVSVTVYYKKQEMEEIKAWLAANYKTSLKSVSFMLHQEHGFKQAPYEEITKHQYYMMVHKLEKVKETQRQTVVQLQHAKDVNDAELQDFECSGGICPIR